MGKWKFLCKCNDGSAFFEDKRTGEIMNWYIKPSMSFNATVHFRVDLDRWVNAAKAN